MATCVLNDCPDVLEEIFQHLSLRDLARAARVCKDWRSAAYCKSLWKRRVVSTARLTPEVLAIWADRGVRRVHFTSASQLTALLRTLTNLDYIHLDFPVSDGDFTAFLNELINGNFRSLKTLKVRFASGSPVGPVTGAFHAVPNLQELAMSRPCLFNPKGYQLTAEDVAGMLSALKSLRRLTLSGYNGTRFRKAAAAPSLTYLCLNCCDPINDGALQAIAVTFPNLCHLELFENCQSHRVDVTNEGLMMAVAQLKKLGRLSLQGLSDINFHSKWDPADGPAIQHCSDALEQLAVSNCSKYFDDVSLQAIVSCYPNLRRLHIVFRAEHTFSPAKRTCFTDEGLTALLSGLQKLNTVTIRHYPRRNFRSGSPMFMLVDAHGEVSGSPTRSGTLPNVRQFQVTYSQSPKPRNLAHFGHDLPQLQEITFRECQDGVGSRKCSVVVSNRMEDLMYRRSV